MRRWFERAVIRELGVGCAVPVGVYASAGSRVKLICEILDSKYLRVEENLAKETAVEEAAEIGRAVRKEIYAGKVTSSELGLEAGFAHSEGLRAYKECRRNPSR